MKRLLLIVLVLLWAVHASAATLTVCASGCDYTNAQIHTAINTAVAGDTILLQSGFTYPECLVLSDNDTSYITLKTGVNSTGGLISEAALFPAPGQRVNPASHAAGMAKISCPDNNTASIRTVYPAETGPKCSTVPCVASFWRIQFLEIIANSYGGGVLAVFGSNDVISDMPGWDMQDTEAEAPTDIDFDRNYVRGLAATGQVHCVAAMGVRITIQNNYIEECWSGGQDAQAIWIINTPGPVTALNNRLQGAGENAMAGGDASRMGFTSNVTISISAGTATSATLLGPLPTFVTAGYPIQVRCASVYQSTTLSTIDAPRTGITFTSIGCTPDIGAGNGGVRYSGIPLSASTATSATLTGPLPDYVDVGYGISLLCSGVKVAAVIATIDGARTGITFANVGCTPDVPGMARGGVIFENITFRYNHVDKPTDWRNPIVATPSPPTLVVGSITGGSLVADTYCYRLVVRETENQGQIARSAASTEVCDAVDSGSSGSVQITWANVAGEHSYRVYGRTTNAQDQWWSVAADTTTFTDTGSAGTAGVFPMLNDTRSACVDTGVCVNATYPVVKNIFEIKNGRTILVEGNIFEQVWRACSDCGQDGTAVLFTTINQDGGNDSTQIADVIARKNLIRHAAGVFGISSQDCDGAFAHRAHTFSITDNLAYDINSGYGASNEVFQFSGCPVPTPRKLPKGVTFAHNTMLSTSGSAALYFEVGGSATYTKATDMIVRDNLMPRLTNGIKGDGTADGIDTWDAYTDGARAFQRNVMPPALGGVIYPTDGTWASRHPSQANFEAAFVDYAQCLLTGSTDCAVDQGCGAFSDTCYDNAGTDGFDIGADIASVEEMTDIALSGDPTGAGISGILTTALSTLVLLSSGTVSVQGEVTPVLYNWAKQTLLDGTLGLTTRTLKVMLVTSAYTFDPDDTFIDTGAVDDPVDARLTGTTDQTLIGKAIGLDASGDLAYFDADDITFASVPTGQSMVALILYDATTGVATTSRLVAYIELAHTTTGASIKIQWPAAASGGILNIRLPEL